MELHVSSCKLVSFEMSVRSSISDVWSRFSGNTVYAVYSWSSDHVTIKAVMTNRVLVSLTIAKASVFLKQ